MASSSFTWCPVLLLHVGSIGSSPYWQVFHLRSLLLNPGSLSPPRTRVHYGGSPNLLFPGVACLHSLCWPLGFQSFSLTQFQIRLPSKTHSPHQIHFLSHASPSLPTYNCFVTLIPLNSQVKWLSLVTMLTSCHHFNWFEPLTHFLIYPTNTSNTACKPGIVFLFVWFALFYFEFCLNSNKRIKHDGWSDVKSKYCVFKWCTVGIFSMYSYYKPELRTLKPARY